MAAITVNNVFAVFYAINLNSQLSRAGIAVCILNGVAEGIAQGFTIIQGFDCRIAAVHIVGVAAV